MNEPQQDPKPANGRDDQAKSDERRFLVRLLDDLSATNPEVCESLMRTNPELAEQHADASRLRVRIHSALRGQRVPLTAAQEQMAERTQASLDERRAKKACESAMPGILTSVTQQLPPEKAVELYRKIAPVFVYQMLGRLNASASLNVVHNVVEHLCSEDVQRRLQASEHVRDAILEELRVVLGRSELGLELSRSEIGQVLEEAGATQDLIAMENCIRLSASKAG